MTWQQLHDNIDNLDFKVIHVDLPLCSFSLEGQGFIATTHEQIVHLIALSLLG
jgi:hypothetical protein